MKLAGDARPFLHALVQAHVEQPLHLPDPELVDEPKQHAKSGNARVSKPIRLVVARLQCEAHSSAALVPNAKAIRRDHMERVFSGHHIRVASGTQDSGFHPILIMGIEPVLESLSFGGREFQGCEAELEGILTGGRQSVASWRQRGSIRQRLLDNHGRRGTDGVRVDRDHAAHGGKPQPAIAGFHSSRAAPIAFTDLHTLREPVREWRNRSELTVGEIVRLLQSKAKNPLVGRQPENTLAIDEDIDDVRGQAVPGSNARKLAISQPVQTASCRKPQSSARIGLHSNDARLRQSLRASVIHGLAGTALTPPNA